MNPVAAAQAAAEAAGVTIDELDGIADLEAAAALFGAVWDTDTEEPVPAALLVAMAHAGAYVAGARSGRELVGAVAAFAGVRSSGPVLHSHIMGVAEVRRGGGVGFAMKLHQRAWCIERNIEAVEWTFDPLIAANAWFNIGRLASDAVEFRSAFYGVMHDGLNAGDETDRLVVSWRLRSDRVAAAAAGHPHAVSIDDAIAAGASVVLRIDEEGVPVSGSSATTGRRHSCAPCRTTSSPCAARAPTCRERGASSCVTSSRRRSPPDTASRASTAPAGTSSRPEFSPRRAGSRACHNEITGLRNFSG